MARRISSKTQSNRIEPPRTRVVPRIVLGAACIGVIPTCAVACGNDRDKVLLGVAAVAFNGFDGGREPGVAAQGFDASRDATGDARATTDVGDAKLDG